MTARTSVERRPRDGDVVAEESATAGLAGPGARQARWDSLRAPLRYERRGPDAQAADALRAHAALTDCKPANLSEPTYRTYLEVLAARMSDTSASLAELAVAMSPPMTKEAFAGQLRRAHAAAGVAITRAERGAQ